MILPFTEDEISTIKSYYNFNHIIKRYANYVSTLNQKDVLELTQGKSKAIGFVFHADNFVKVNQETCGVFNIVKHFKKPAVYLNYRFLYPQLKTGKVRAERVLDYIVFQYKNIFIKDIDSFAGNNYANTLLSYLVELAYEEEKRIIIGTIEDDFDLLCSKAFGYDTTAAQIAEMYVKVRLQEAT